MVAGSCRMPHLVRQNGHKYMEGLGYLPLRSQSCALQEGVDAQGHGHQRCRQKGYLCRDSAVGISHVCVCVCVCVCVLTSLSVMCDSTCCVH